VPEEEPAVPEVPANPEETIAAFRKQLPKAGAFHMSGKIVVDNGMRFRREGVPMGLPGLDEFSLWLTDAEKVREAVAVLKGAATC
jgi:copper homeostasis protein